MATMYTTGPVLVWVGPQVFKPNYAVTLPGGAPIYLGTAEVSPQAEERVQQQPAYNDLGGAVPFDLNFLGADVIGAIDLTRWNEATVAAIERIPSQAFGASAAPAGGAVVGVGVGATGPVRGTYNALGGMGALMAHFGYTMTVYYVFPYGNAGFGGPGGATMIANGMPAGYRFHGVSRISTKLHQMGNKHRKTHLTFQSAPVYDYTTGNFTLYDTLIPSGLVTSA